MGTILKYYRISKNMSKAELASKARVSKTYITKIERNLSFPSPVVLKRISLALNICPYDLLDFCNNCTLSNCCKKIF